MRTTCPNCNNALTIREVIQRSCTKCASRKRQSVEAKSSDSSSIKTNFDFLISEELKKRSLESAA